MFFSARNELSKERKSDLLSFQKDAEIRFRSLELLNLSFIHRSCSNEDSARGGNNEKLEFVGDSVLGMVVATRLFELLGDRSEGDLARIKSYVVSEAALAGIAKQLRVDRYLILGKGEEQSGGREKKAILADAMEAIIGAYYLDAGFEAAARFVLSLVEPEIRKVLQNRHAKDYKTILQEYVQKYHRGYPKYVLEKKTGPDHDRTFWISCEVVGVVHGPTSGKNKKEAEQSAAKLAYDAIVGQGGLEAARLLQIDSQ
ncbi:MAG: ribonuclease III [Spirochaetaceae bacterium]|nr:ribonuclease III [Spirochaetaceae bacterium]